MSLQPRKEDYLRENRKTTSRKYMRKTKLPTQVKSNTYLTWCPLDCTQNQKGKRTKKTFHKTKKICLNCGFKLGR